MNVLMPIFKNDETLKTTTIGVIGTGISITLKSFSEWASALAAALTALYMGMKCLDWLLAKRFATHEGGCSNFRCNPVEPKSPKRARKWKK
jgi:hypothetical protein